MAGRKRLEVGPMAGAMAALGGAFLLSACVAGQDGLGFLAASQPNDRGIRTLSVLDGAVRVRAPEGYCVDQRASRASTGFAVLAGCALVSDVNVLPSIQGLITIQIGAEGSQAVSGNQEALRALMGRPEGAALLSSNGDPASVTVAEARAEGPVVEVYFTDSVAPSVAGLDSREWRAFLDLHGRLVTVGVRGYAHAPIGMEQGAALLRAAVLSLLAANRDENAIPGGALPSSDSSSG